jgi:hypothetical protein
MSGMKGENRDMEAKRLKNSSSCPKTIEGRRMMLSRKAAATRSSPSALVRA